MQNVTVYSDFTKLLRRIMPAVLAVAGYLSGSALFVLCGGNDNFNRLPAPALSSAFDSASPISALITCFSDEFKYILIVYMLGFCIFGKTAVCFVLAFRSFLSGFSATYLLAGAYPLSLYLIHTTTGLTALAALCCMGLVCCEFCRKSKDACARAHNRITAAAVVEYTAKCLFITGGIFACVLLRHLLITLVL